MIIQFWFPRNMHFVRQRWWNLRRLSDALRIRVLQPPQPRIDMVELGCQLCESSSV